MNVGGNIMALSRNRIIFKNVAPAILANACVFLFSVVDGIFVGSLRIRRYKPQGKLYRKKLFSGDFPKGLILRCF